MHDWEEEAATTPNLAHAPQPLPRPVRWARRVLGAGLRTKLCGTGAGPGWKEGLQTRGRESAVCLGDRAAASWAAASSSHW